MNRLTLQDIHATEMNILDEIDTVCKQLGISYFLAYGSLLGAIRHQGFIPWDDDMDIFMIRKDYEMLVDHFNELTSNKTLELLIYRDGRSNLPYAKVVDKTTRVEMRFIKDEYATGIWVDIFPLDFIPSEKPPLLTKEKFYFYSRVLATSIPSPDRPNWQNAVLNITSLAFSLLNPLKMAEGLDDAARRCCPTPTDYYCDIVGEPEHPRCYRREWFVPIEVPFENRTYLAPAGFREILETSYGNWEELPPKDKRVPHCVEAYRINNVPEES